MSKVKEFLKEHKKELIIGSVSAVGGAVISTVFKNKVFGEDKELIDILRSFSESKEDGSRLITNVIASIGDSNFTEVHRFGGNYGPVTVEEVGKLVTRYYEHNGIDLNTKVNGLVLFETRN